MTLLIVGESTLVSFDTVFTRHLVAFDSRLRRPEAWIFSCSAWQSDFLFSQRG